jgi:hypothetical protein
MTTIAQLREGLHRPHPEARPLMRWWWFGPDVSDDGIDHELHAMADAGLGGAEIAFVYPLSEVTEHYGSPQMYAHVRHAADTAHALGLRLDVTLGSGWSFGGAHIGPDHAARRLAWERQDASPAAFDVDVTPRWPGDELVAAYVGEGFPPREWTWLTGADDVAGTPAGTSRHLHVPSGRGPRTVLLAWSRTTGQQVKRQSAGAEGPVLDHYSAEAVRHHLQEVGEPLLEAVPGHLLGSVFSDSLEVYGADWTPALPAEFVRRRGYDLLPEMYRLAVGDPPGAPAVVAREGVGSPAAVGPHDAARLRRDLGRTLTELVEENMLAVCEQWAQDHGTRFRVQAYGVPPVSVSSYRHVALIEGESWGWDGLPQTRWASSAAHLLGRDVVSSETWTWLHSPSFRATPLDVKGEAHEHLLLGINQLIGHGWPYHSERADGTAADGVGPTFYAAGALDERNTWWPAMPSLTDYLARLCWTMRQGRASADVALYVPTDDVFTRHGAGVDLWREAAAMIGPEIPAAIRRGGWDLDLVDDTLLETLDGTDHRVLVLPSVRELPARTRDRIRALVEDRGLQVIAVGSPVRGAADGVRRTNRAGLRQALAEVLAPALRIDGGGDEIGVVRRHLEDGDLYLVVNTGARIRDLRVRPREHRDRYEIHDPRTGIVQGFDDPTGGVPIRLHPYQAVVLTAGDAAPPVCDASEGAGAERRQQDPEQIVQVLDGAWSFAYDDESAATRHPITLPHRWEEEREGYSGGGTYRTTFTLGATTATTQILLDLGPGSQAPSDESRGPSGPSYRTRLDPPAREIAEVRVNGIDAGTVWDAPFALDIGRLLREGENELELHVLNTTANAAAADPRAAHVIAGSHARYGRRFEQQDLELTLDGVSSGLMVAPVLREAREVH